MNTKMKRLGLVCSWVVFLCLSPQFAMGKKEKELRQFTTEINPGCNFARDCKDWTTINLIHIRSDSKEDSLHFVWSLVGRPTMIMARTSHKSQLKVDWNQYLQPDTDDDISVSFTGETPYYTFGWSLPTVWVYNDTSDTARMDKANQTQMHSYSTHGFLWERQNETILTSDEIHLNFISEEYKHRNTSYSLGENGYFGIKIRMKNTDDYSDFLPYMMYSGNSSQVDISFNNIELNFTGEFPYPTAPRIGLTYAFVQGDTSKDGNKTMKVERVPTLDDEYSPGVFEVFHLRSPVLHEYDQSFMQWRPICYTAAVRDIPDSIDVKSYDLTKANESEKIEGLNQTILWSFYGKEIESLLIQGMNISFGTEQDGYYTKTKHISWSYSIGFGTPPEDRTSLLVTLVILIGLGIPVIIIVASVLYVLSKRFKKPRDDLLLPN